MAHVYIEKFHYNKPQSKYELIKRDKILRQNTIDFFILR